MKLLSIIAVSCLGIIVYSNTFFCSFHFDDFVFIVTNSCIKDLHGLQSIWDFWPCRFITFFSFALNYHFYQLNVFGYHLFNLAVHLFSALLVWRLVSLTFLTPVMKEERISRHAGLIALFTGLVFVAHPVQTQAVTFIWQRAASMAAMFYLASLCFYVNSRLVPSLPGRFSYIFSLLTAVMAMFTKEIAITLPLMVLLYEFCFFNTKRIFNWKPLVPFFFILLVIPVVWIFSDPEKAQSRQSFVAYISPMQYFFTEGRVMLTYIRLAFLPLHQNLDYDFSISKNFFEAPVLFSFLFLAAVLFFAKRMFLKYRLISFSIFWFFLTLLPESSFFPFADVIFEHRLYLPMAGFSLFLVSAVYYLSGQNTLPKMVIALTMITACYSILTYQRNKVWRNEITLWGDTVHKSPHKARPHDIRGIALVHRGNYNQAIIEYNKAIEIYPEFSEAYYNRGIAFARQRNFIQALSDFDKAIDKKPDYAAAYYNRAVVYYLIKEYPQAWGDVRNAEKLGYAVNPQLIYGLKQISQF
jgi:protein O-mannosyl-transferase